MSALTEFTFEGHEVRTIDLDGTTWFVLNDLCRVLGIVNTRNVAARLDDDMKGVRPMDTLGGRQNLTIVSEAGMYDVIVRSDSPLATPFRRWITTEVLPSIRRTGSYGAPAALTGPELMAAALIEAQATLAAKDAEIRTLAPKASAFDGFIGAAGDFSFNEAAKLLQRRGVDTGQYKLVKTLEAWGWLYRGRKNAPRAMQAQLDTGRLAEKTHYFIDQDTGERRAGSTQVRVTPKGVDDAFKRLSGPVLLKVEG